MLKVCAEDDNHNERATGENIDIYFSVELIHPWIQLRQNECHFIKPTVRNEHWTQQGIFHHYFLFRNDVQNLEHSFGCCTRFALTLMYCHHWSLMFSLCTLLIHFMKCLSLYHFKNNNLITLCVRDFFRRTVSQKRRRFSIAMDNIYYFPWAMLWFSCWRPTTRGRWRTRATASHVELRQLGWLPPCRSFPFFS